MIVVVVVVVISAVASAVEKARLAGVCGGGAKVRVMAMALVLARRSEAGGIAKNDRLLMALPRNIRESQTHAKANGKSHKSEFAVNLSKKGLNEVGSANSHGW